MLITKRRLTLFGFVILFVIFHSSRYTIDKTKYFSNRIYIYIFIDWPSFQLISVELKTSRVVLILHYFM